MEQTERKELRRNFSRLGWTLILSQVFFLAAVWSLQEVQFWAIQLLHPELGMQEIVQRLYDSGITLIAGCLLAIAPFWLLRLPQPRTLFLQEHRPVSLQMMALFFLLMMGLQMTASVITVPFELFANAMGGSFFEAAESASAASVTPSMLFYSVLFAPFSEELIYRGFVMQYLRPKGKSFAIVFAAILFGLMHGNVIQLPMAILCGCLLGYVAMEYSLPAAMVLHSLVNLYVEATGWISSADEVLGGMIGSAVTAFGLIALLLVLSGSSKKMRAYLATHQAKKGSMRCLLTSAPMLLVIAYLIFATLSSITPL